MPTPAPVRPAPRFDVPPPLNWRDWPLRAGGQRLWSWLLPAGGLGLAAAGLVSLSMWRFFVPTDYEFNHQGVHERLLRRTRRLAWKSIEAVDLSPWGAHLTPERTGFWPVRRMYVRWDQRRDDALAILQYYLDGVRPRPNERVSTPADRGASPQLDVPG